MNQPFYLIAGLGKTGLSIASYLTRRHYPFMVYDTRQTVDGLADFQKQFPGVDIFLKDLPSAVYSSLKAIIASPGVALDQPFLQQAFALNIPVYGDIECLAKEIQAPVIAITGTNGKSTVTSLVGDMAKAAGISVAVGGNIGTPVLDLLDNGIQYDLWVLELSSFQLDLTHSLKPRAATILNISPDHLDRHHSLDAYVNAKQGIYQHAQTLLYNRDDLRTFPKQNISNLQTVQSYGLDEPEDGQWGILYQDGLPWLAHGKRGLLPVDALAIKGTHNWQNALAACALASAAGISEEVICQVLQSFKGLPHRCQWVRTLNGVDWINDSKGTNIGATQSAIKGIGASIKGQIVLIAGGLGKGADFRDLRQPVSEYLRSLILIGKDADKIEQALGDMVPVTRASSFEDAIAKARLQAQAGDVVLLSPACASMDMFKDFNHRGDCFADLVGQL